MRVLWILPSWLFLCISLMMMMLTKKWFVRFAVVQTKVRLPFSANSGGVFWRKEMNVIFSSERASKSTWFYENFVVIFLSLARRVFLLSWAHSFYWISYVLIISSADQNRTEKKWISPKRKALLTFIVLLSFFEVIRTDILLVFQKEVENSA